MKDKDLEVAVASAMAKQAAQQRATGGMQVVQNNRESAVNFAVEDFHKAAVVMKKATKDFTVAMTDLPPGVQSFVQQQFFRMNAAGLLLDSLGFQGVTEVMAYYNQGAVDYINTTMAAWNKIINDEGEVKKIYESIAADEQAQANPPASMQ